MVRVYKDYQKTILFYSESGSNGKGTLCALLRGLVTDSESISILEFSDEYALSNIFFVNAIICDENSVGSFAKASSRFKAAVSGDPFMVNRKYLPPITGCFYGRIIECVNELPRFADFNGIRDIPMLPDVEKAFKNVIKNRPTVNEEIVWDETHQFSKTGFLWIDKDGKYEVAQHWQNHIKDARNRFNELYKDELPPISPHVIRHTFCSNCAGSGMSPKTLQVIMGHSSIEFTLNVYTHVEAGDVKKNFFSFMNTSNYDLCGYNRTPDIVSPDDDIDIKEEDVNYEEAIDDDE